MTTATIKAVPDPVDHRGVIEDPSHVRDYLTYLAASASPATVRLRGSQLRTAERACRCLLEAGPGELLVWLTSGAPRPETYKSRRCALVSFYRWARLWELRVDDPTERLPVRRVPPADPRPTPSAIVEAAWQAASARDRVAIALAVHMGLRRGEIAAACAGDVEDGLLRVRGKGGRDRLVPVPPTVAPLLPEVGPLVPSLHHGGHLEPDAVGKLLARCLGSGWSGHTLRHRFATDCHERAGVLVTQRLLGHASAATTQRYVLVDVAQLRAAMNAA